MDERQKKEKVLIAKLQSQNKSQIIEALQEIKESGTIALLPYIFDLINDNIEYEIKQEVYFILSNIHDKNAPQYYIKAIEEKDFGSLKSEVISLCWQSSLDFSPYIETFAQIMLNTEDFQTALEAFTVIENSLNNATIESLRSCLNFLKNNQSNINLINTLNNQLIDLIIKRL